MLPWTFRNTTSRTLTYISRIYGWYYYWIHTFDLVKSIWVGQGEANNLSRCVVAVEENISQCLFVIVSVLRIRSYSCSSQWDGSYLQITNSGKVWLVKNKRIRFVNCDTAATTRFTLCGEVDISEDWSVTKLQSGVILEVVERWSEKTIRNQVESSHSRWEKFNRKKWKQFRTKEKQKFDVIHSVFPFPSMPLYGAPPGIRWGHSSSTGRALVLVFVGKVGKRILM